MKVAKTRVKEATGDCAVAYHLHRKSELHSNVFGTSYSDCPFRHEQHRKPSIVFRKIIQERPHERRRFGAAAKIARATRCQIRVRRVLSVPVCSVQSCKCPVGKW